MAAALCPATPLLIGGLSGAEPVLPDLRRACLDAVAQVIAAGPDVVAVVGAAGMTRQWDPESVLDQAIFAPGAVHQGFLAARGSGLPPSVGVGAWLLTELGYGGPRLICSVGADESPNQCAETGAALASAGRRVGLLVMAEGSACRTPKAPGYFDERSERFDAAIERAIRDGDLSALFHVDSGLARELLATGVPALQALAGAMPGPVASRVAYCDAPLGVGYLVAFIRQPILRDHGISPMERLGSRS